MIRSRTALLYVAAAAMAAALAAPAAAKPPAAPTMSVAVTPAGRRLGTGNVLTVSATGPTHGVATFTITGVRTDLPMTESPAHPGAYTGRYVVQPGDYAAGANVVVKITSPRTDGEVLSTTGPVSINTSAIIPPAVAGAPVIVSPAPGTALRAPFTVRGTAPPGSFVRVEARYRADLLGSTVLGTLGTRIVAADANGNWQATFGQAPPVRGVDVTISAIRVDDAGAARSPAIEVDATLN